MEGDYSINRIPNEVIYNNVDYYNKWQDRYPGKNFFVSWNWPAFFVGHIWLIYRRCYLGALAMYIAQVVLITFVSNWAMLIDDTGILMILLNLLSAIPVGMFANSFYFYFMKNKMKNYIGRESELLDKCRPNGMPVVIYYAIVFGSYILLGILLFFFILAMAILAGLITGV